MPHLSMRLRLLFIVLFLFFISIRLSYAAGDGFTPEGKIESKYFTIFYTSGVSLPEVNRRLGLSVSDNFLSGVTAEKKISAEAQLALGMDYLFEQVCDALDMRLYSFRGVIKLCRDYAQLNMIYKDFFKKNLGTRSFYVYSLNSIYTSADNFKLGIVAHEMAHVIISHYFPVLPSAKVQEVLAMYVEYQLRATVQ